MTSIEPQQKKIKPIVFLDQFLCEKIQRKSTYGSTEASHVSLSKYFPKYYKNLSLSSKTLTESVQSKVKRLKIVRSCYDSANLKDDEKTFKKLFKTNRKTLKDLPISGDYDAVQNFSLCLYFPRIKTLDLKKQCRSLRNSYQLQLKSANKSIQKTFSRSFGHFWTSCRFAENLKIGVESLKIGAENDTIGFLIFKKINSSKRFLSSLKNIELGIYLTQENIQSSRNLLMELMKNENFLRHMTHLRMEKFYEKSLDWEVFQSFINHCPQLSFVSLSTGSRESRSGPIRFYARKDFRLDLSHLQNLRWLEIEVNHFRTFINGIQFPPFLQDMSLKIADHEESDNLKELFDYQESQDEKTNYMLLDEGESSEKNEDSQDDCETSEQSKMLKEFFEKLKKLENLRVFNLTLDAFSNMDTLFKSFFLSLLRALPNLETFNLEYFSHKPNWSFDLEAFLSGIEQKGSLRHLKIQTDPQHNCVFSGSCPPQKLACLSKLSLIEIDMKIHSRFDFKQFLDGFLRANDSELMIKKSLKLPRLYFFRVQDFIRFLDLMHSVSNIENFEAYLEISMVVENIKGISSNFQNPIIMASNIQLVVNIFIKDFESTTLTQEQEQYFQMVFGKLQFTVKKVDPSESEARLFNSRSRSHRELTKNKLIQKLLYRK